MEYEKLIRERYSVRKYKPDTSDLSADITPAALAATKAALSAVQVSQIQSFLLTPMRLKVRYLSFTVRKLTRVIWVRTHSSY